MREDVWLLRSGVNLLACLLRQCITLTKHVSGQNGEQSVATMLGSYNGVLAVVDVCPDKKTPGRGL